MSAIKKPVYLDYMATTPVDPQVVKKMQPYLTLDGIFANPASNTHDYGIAAHNAVEQARSQVATLINADPKEIIWTSGATEANNLALFGIARFHHNRGKHIITVKTEHKAVLDPCQQLEREGFEVSYLTPNNQGLISCKQIEDSMRPDTILVSVMHVNNEIGVIQNITKIADLTRSKGIFFHVDAAQSAGKIAIDLQQSKVDLMSFSAHKIYGPKGIGALFVRRQPRVRLQPLIFGGGHENGLRSGTLATHQIVGMGEAFQIAKKRLKQDHTHISKLTKQLLNGIKPLSGIHLNGDLNHRFPGNINITIVDVNPVSLLLALRELAISTASACSAATTEPSHVLHAIGLSAEDAYRSIRISIGRFTTAAEIDFAIDTISHQVNRLRAIAA